MTAQDLIEVALGSAIVGTVLATIIYIITH